MANMGLRTAILQQFKGDSAMKKPAETAIGAGTVSVLERLGKRHIQFGQIPKSLRPVIAKLTQPQPVESNQRRQQREAARSTRDFLASRIQWVQEKIHALQAKTPGQAPTPSLSPDTLKTYRKEQLARDKKRKALLQTQEEQLLQDSAQAELDKQALAAQRVQEKQQLLAALQQKRAERQVKLQAAKEAARRGVREKPRFLHMEEDYDRRASELECERRYESLSRRSQARAAPVDEWRLRPMERSVQRPAERVVVLPQTPTELHPRHALVMRQKQYAALVKEVYVPSHDRLKAKEMDFIKENHLQPVVKKVYFSSTVEYRSSPRRSPTPEKSESVVRRNYLQDLRSQRERRENRLLKSLESISFKNSRNIHRVEATARRQDTALRQGIKSGCFDPLNVEPETCVSQLLLSSVRAKAAMLL